MMIRAVYELGLRKGSASMAEEVSQEERETSFFGRCWGLQYRLIATDKAV